jgi:hypothetical protein
MYLKLVHIHQIILISQGGHYLKQEDRLMKEKNLIEIKHMTQDQHLVVKHIQKIVLDKNVTLEQVVEDILKN